MTRIAVEIGDRRLAVASDAPSQTAHVASGMLLGVQEVDLKQGPLFVLAMRNTATLALHAVRSTDFASVVQTGNSIVYSAPTTIGGSLSVTVQVIDGPDYVRLVMSPPVNGTGLSIAWIYFGLAHVEAMSADDRAYIPAWGGQVERDPATRLGVTTVAGGITTVQDPYDADLPTYDALMGRVYFGVPIGDLVAGTTGIAQYPGLQSVGSWLVQAHWGGGRCFVSWVPDDPDHAWQVYCGAGTDHTLLGWLVPLEGAAAANNTLASSLEIRMAVIDGGLSEALRLYRRDAPSVSVTTHGDARAAVAMMVTTTAGTDETATDPANELGRNAYDVNWFADWLGIPSHLRLLALWYGWSEGELDNPLNWPNVTPKSTYAAARSALDARVVLTVWAQPGRWDADEASYDYDADRFVLSPGGALSTNEPDHAEDLDMTDATTRGEMVAAVAASVPADGIMSDTIASYQDGVINYVGGGTGTLSRDGYLAMLAELKTATGWLIHSENMLERFGSVLDIHADHGEFGDPFGFQRPYGSQALVAGGRMMRTHWVSEFYRPNAPGAVMTDGEVAVGILTYALQWHDGRIVAFQYAPTAGATRPANMIDGANAGEMSVLRAIRGLVRWDFHDRIREARTRGESESLIPGGWLDLWSREDASVTTRATIESAYLHPDGLSMFVFVTAYASSGSYSITLDDDRYYLLRRRCDVIRHESIYVASLVDASRVGPLTLAASIVAGGTHVYEVLVSGSRDWAGDNYTIPALCDADGVELGFTSTESIGFSPTRQRELGFSVVDAIELEPGQVLTEEIV